MSRYKISGRTNSFEDMTLVGIITNRDIRFKTNLTKKIDDATDRASYNWRYEHIHLWKALEK